MEQKRRRITPTDLLQTLKKELIADELRLNFNYLGFTSFCLELLLGTIGAGMAGMLTAETTGMRAFYQAGRFLLKSAADAQAADQPLATTPFGKAAIHLQSALAQADHAKKFSKEASDRSSSRIPKSQRPVFAPLDDKREAAIEALLAANPAISVGSSRQTIEIYAPQGTTDDFHDMLEIPEMIHFMQPNGRWKKSVSIIPRADQAAAAEKLSRSGGTFEQYKWKRPEGTIGAEAITDASGSTEPPLPGSEEEVDFLTEAMSLIAPGKFDSLNASGNARAKVGAVRDAVARGDL